MDTRFFLPCFHGPSAERKGRKKLVPLLAVRTSHSTNKRYVQYNIMQDITLNTLQYSTIKNKAIHFNTLQYNTIQYITIQYITIQYITIQYITIQYNTFQVLPASFSQQTHGSVVKSQTAISGSQ